MGTDGIANIGLFLEFLGNLGTVDSVWIIGILIGHLTNVVQQTGTLSLLRIQSQFSSHHSTEVGRLASVLQQVLTITGTILHLTDDADEFGV